MYSAYVLYFDANIMNCSLYHVLRNMKKRKYGEWSLIPMVDLYCWWFFVFIDYFEWYEMFDIGYYHELFLLTLRIYSRRVFNLLRYVSLLPPTNLFYSKKLTQSFLLSSEWQHEWRIRLAWMSLCDTGNWLKYNCCVELLIVCDSIFIIQVLKFIANIIFPLIIIHWHWS